MRKILIPALLLLLTFSVSAAPVIRQRQFARLNYCNVYDLLKINRFNVRIQQKKLLASARNRNLVFEHKQRKFQFNGQRVELGFPLVYNGNQSWLTVADWQKTLRPLLYPATAAKHRIYTIYLDMGHGGSDPGAIGRFSKEKNIRRSSLTSQKANCTTVIRLLKSAIPASEARLSAMCVFFTAAKSLMLLLICTPSASEHRTAVSK